MKKIDITTTQNVTIEYQLAGVFERMGAFLLDLLIMIFSYIILYFMLTGIFMVSQRVASFITYFPFLFYSLFFEVINNGQSPGKMVLKIKVIKITGEKAGFFDYFMRWTFRMIDVTLTLGTLAALTISSSRKSQRIGDILADTTVIKLIDQNRFSLDRILKIDTLSTYTPMYPNVITFNEDEMLLIKETIDRFTNYPNQGHVNAINELIKKIEEQLQIKAPVNKIDFLNTLIKDYVALTR